MSRAPELSCGLPPGPDFVDLAVLAEELGYSRVWIFGSAPLWEDPFIHLALAAEKTSSVGLAIAVLVPTERPPMTTASAIATIARLSHGRFRACFGTGYTARRAIGQKPVTIDALIDHVATIRSLLAGETVVQDGHAAKMLHSPQLAQRRPIDAPLWLSVFGPRGNAAAPLVADGIIGPPHSTLPTATMVSGTVLEPDETQGSPRVREALGPWRVGPWHNAYADGGATAVDALPGGVEWRHALEAVAPDEERLLATFEGHVTDLTDRDRLLLDHIDTRAMVGDEESIGRKLGRLGDAGFAEVMYTPTGPNVAQELRTFAAAHQHTIA